MTVYLVGAGPGDPGLLTVRGFAVLTGADVVVYDRLASPTLLEVVPAGAELISAGKAPGQVDLTQDEINAVLVDRGRTGATVVRLKGGDPFVFGRGGEEAEALAAAGVPYEVVPGVTSAIGALAYAGIPVTHRGVSTHFTVVTGHEDPAKDRTDVDWDALARVGGTLVILMGAGKIGDIAQRLVDGGLDPATPVAAVRNGTRPDQQTVRATLATIKDAGVRAPSAIVVGDVAALDLVVRVAPALRPLGGRHARASRQASCECGLEALGAEVLELPTISIEPLDFSVPSLGDFGWLVFTSVNGVDAFFDRGLDPAGLDARALAGLRVAAIGPSTERALLARGIRIDIAPDRFVAESLLDAFPDPAVAGERVLLVRAEQGRDVLPEGLAASGYAVEVLPVYRTVRAEPDTDVLARVQAGNVDAITFTSSSTVDNLCDLLGAPFNPQAEPQPVVVSIGPATSDTARARGLRVDVEAADHTIDGVVAALLEVLASRNPSDRRHERRQNPEGSVPSWPVSFPERRMRRLRRTPALRRLVAEARLSVDDLVAPLFVKEGIDAPEAVASMPGVVQHTQESLRKEVRALADLGVPAVILFGVPAHKDATGSGADAPDGVVQIALRNLRDEVGDDLVLMADDCLDEYTDHGHCGLLTAGGEVDNDATLERYATIAIAQADAGADVIAPSGMMDGQVGAIRAALDESSHADAAILAYAAKYASVFYGPFRDAAECAPQFGDRRGYQMDPANARGTRRSRPRHRGRRRHGDGQAGAAVSRRARRCVPHSTSRSRRTT